MGAARDKRVLFVQGADPSFYPPIIHASATLAASGWEVTILSTPQLSTGLETPVNPAIEEIRMHPRSSYRVGARDYFAYCRKTIATALRLRPNVVYASDPLGAAPGLLAAKVSGALLVYHEHDSPEENSGRRLVRLARRLAAQTADLVIFPNAKRAAIVQSRIGFKDTRLRIVWNLPSLGDLPVLTKKTEAPVVVYYHGSITPERLPESVPAALARFGGSVLLRIAGYEAPTGKGYVASLEDRWGRSAAGGIIDWVGPLPYKELLAQASKLHVGLALMPMETDDINMAHMAGASNKAFDYMAAGMALIVSDLPEWNDLFVEPGHAVTCDPRDENSVEAALRRLIDQPIKRDRMARLARQKIEQCWHYETHFGPIVAELDRAIADRTPH